MKIVNETSIANKIVIVSESEWANEMVSFCVAFFLPFSHYCLFVSNFVCEGAVTWM